MNTYSKTIGHKLILVLPLIIYGFFYISAFAMLEKIDRSWFITPQVPFDKAIPFIPCFVVPYMIWFAWVPAVCGLLVIEDEEIFLRARRLLIIGMTAFLIISAVFPTKLFLRPDEVPDGVFGALLNNLYSADTATNVFPSIHVYNTCAIWHAVFESRKGIFGKRWFRAAASVISILIIMSTMFIKQHSIIDVAGGMIMFYLVLEIVRVFFEGKSEAYVSETGSDE